jgi:hypothetical protein
MDNFYYTLQSNASKNIHPNNIPTNFKVHLPNRICLHGEWVVGLAEIHFPTIFDPLKLKEQLEQQRIDNQQVNYRNSDAIDPAVLDTILTGIKSRKKRSPLLYVDPITSGVGMLALAARQAREREYASSGPRFSDAQLAALNQRFKKHIASTELTSKESYVTDDGDNSIDNGIDNNDADIDYTADTDNSDDGGDDTNAGAMTTYEHTDLPADYTKALSGNFFNFKKDGRKYSGIELNYTDYINQLEHLKRGKHLTDNNRPKQLYIYCDIAELEFIGDKFGSFLRIVRVPPYYPRHETAEKEFAAPHYKKVARNNFDSLEIDIRDERGRLVSFANGEVIVTLHFKRVR